MAKRKKNQDAQNSGARETQKGKGGAPAKGAAKQADPNKTRMTRKERAAEQAKAEPAEARRKGSAAASGNRRRAMQAGAAKNNKEGYLASMSHAPRIDEGLYGFHLLPAAVFAAVVILIVRQYQYARDMSVYYWSSASADKPLMEFFSHYKVVLIEVVVVLAILLLLYRIVTQSFFVKRSPLYIPMAIYLLFVLLSLVFSENKDVAWNGWNDRFEGTAVIFCYIIMLFYIINSVNSERNVKWILYPIAGSSVLLSLIGIMQATGHDFFQTALGQKLIVPNNSLSNGMTAWQMIDESLKTSGTPWLSFTFKNNEIYQTVYNINYVAFYLTLLLPLFGLLFIREKHIAKKIAWGAILALVFYNLLGAASSGGMFGVGILLIVAIVLLNKRLLKWWKSVALLLIIVVGVGALSYATTVKFGGFAWTQELFGTVRETLSSKDTAKTTPVQPAADAGTDGQTTTNHVIDYFTTKDDQLTFSVDGNVATMTMTSGGGMAVADSKGAEIVGTQDSESGEIRFADERFNFVSITPAKDQEENTLLVLKVDGSDQQWPFMLTGANKTQLLYRNDLGKTVGLENIPHWGFKNNPSFGSGRGYIWSASLPLIRDTILVGHGADSYILYFPHKDYIGKYNAGWTGTRINMIVDKPHNMYIGMAVNTGLISLLAFLALLGIYLVQSFRLYWREEYDSFAAFVGAGIFLGICGFMAAAITNDSTVSVMPMFYALLGTGVAVNIMVGRRRKLREQ